MEIFDKLLSAIKTDNVQLYDSLKKTVGSGDLRYGRFPLLSLMYLYKAKRLISLYEKNYLNIVNYRVCDEPIDLYVEFAKKAGRCLRLYIGGQTVVSPLEMLLILGKTHKLRKSYSIALCTPTIRNNLKSLYSIKYGLSLDFDGRDIVMDKRPLSFTEKRRLLIASISTFLCIAIIISTPFIINSFVPFIGVNNNQGSGNGDNSTPNDNENSNTDNPQETPKPSVTLDVTDVSQIDFGSSNVYNLKNDITIPSSIVKSNCTINGNGFKINFPANAPLFTTMAGTLDNIKFSPTNNEFSFNKKFAFIAENNTGTIKNCELELNGQINVALDENKNSETTYLSGFVITNTGFILNSTLNANLVLNGNTTANASFSGFSALNSREIEGCILNGTISSTTVDVAGICDTNRYSVEKCENKANISQTTAEHKWSPLVVGICANNYNLINECKNTGNLSAYSTYKSEQTDTENTSFYMIKLSGIVITNQYAVVNCTNDGNLHVESKENVLYLGGVVTETELSSLISTPIISACINNGTLTATTEKTSIYSGGIFAVCNYGSCMSSTNNGSVTATITQTPENSSEIFVGGICGYIKVGSVTKSKNTAILLGTAPKSTVVSGGITALSNFNSTVTYSENIGKVSSISESGDAYSGGVAGLNRDGIAYVTNSGEIISNGGNVSYSGGICAISFSLVQYCHNLGSVKGTSKGACYSGGINGYAGITDNTQYIYYSRTKFCISSGSVSANTVSDEKKAFAGGINGYTAKVLYNKGTENEIHACATVNSNFFVGTLEISDKTVLGEISGCIDKYIVDNNETTTEGASSQYNYCFDNFFLTKETPIFGMGSVVSVNNEEFIYDSGNNMGSSSLSLAEIESNQTYVSIINALTKKEETAN